MSIWDNYECDGQMSLNDWLSDRDKVREVGIHRREGFGPERIQRLYDQIIEVGEASKWSVDKLDSKLMELVGLSIDDDFLKGADT